jgi:hypothetical protein
MYGKEEADGLVMKGRNHEKKNSNNKKNNQQTYLVIPQHGHAVKHSHRNPH